MCDCSARDHGAWVTIQPYCLPMRSDAENVISVFANYYIDAFLLDLWGIGNIAYAHDKV